MRIRSRRSAEGAFDEDGLDEDEGVETVKRSS
jgi:hypothetical protein